MIVKWRCIRSAIFFGLFIGKPPDRVLTTLHGRTSGRDEEGRFPQG